MKIHLKMNSEKINSANKASTQLLKTKMSSYGASVWPNRNLTGDRICSCEENTSQEQRSKTSQNL